MGDRIKNILIEKFKIMGLLKFTFCFLVIFFQSAFAEESSKFKILQTPEKIAQIRIWGDFEDGKSKKDENGKWLSGIRIITPIDNIVVDSRSGVYGRETKPGEVFVYVSPYETALTIYASGHEPLKIILREQGIRLKESEAWEIKLKTNSTKKISDEKGNFILDSKPTGATITIDGFPTFSEKTPFTFKNWIAQPYKIKMELEGNEDYQILESVILIEGNQTLENTYSLEPAFGFVKFSAENGAKFILDQEEVGTTTYSGKVGIGEHSLTIKKEWYRTLDTLFTIEGGENLERDFKLEPTFGNIEIVTNEGAEIYLDGELVGKGSYSGKVKIGEHNLKIGSGKKFNYHLETFQISALENKRINRLVNAKTGRLLASSLPTEAELFLNGELRGNTINEELTVGIYNLKSQLFPRYITQEQTVTIEEGKTSKVIFKLTSQSKSLTQNFDKWKSRRNIFLYSSLAFLASGVSSQFLNNSAVNDYKTATSTSAVNSSKDSADRWKMISLGTYAVGGVLSLATIYSFFKEQSYKNELNSFSLNFVPSNDKFAVEFRIWN